MCSKPCQSCRHLTLWEGKFKTGFRVFELVLRLNFCWTPSHVGIPGNEIVDAAAKVACTLPPLPFLLPHRDFYSILKRSLYERWQSEWKTKTTHLRFIKPTLGKWTTSNRKSPQEEVVLGRLRIGHTRFTHGHILAGNLRPRCESCNKNLTVFHILVESSQNKAVRTSCFPTLSSIPLSQKLFHLLTQSPSFSVDGIFKFLKLTKLYYEI